MTGLTSGPLDQARLLGPGLRWRSLDEVSKNAHGGGGSGDTLTSGHGGSGQAVAAASRRGGTATTSLASSLGRGRGGRAGSAAGAARSGLSRVLGTAVRHDVGLASLLVSSVADVLRVAEVEELQADGSGHSLSVELETWSAVIGATDARVVERGGRACIRAVVVVAELRAAIGLGAAPLSSLLSSDLVRVDFHVERAGVVLDLGGRSASGSESEDESLDEHCDCVEGCD